MKSKKLRRQYRRLQDRYADVYNLLGATYEFTRHEETCPAAHPAECACGFRALDQKIVRALWGDIAAAPPSEMRHG